MQNRRRMMQENAGINHGSGPADLTAMKERQRAAWAAGDYSLIGATLQIVGETLCEAVDLRGGERVIDVAAGNGNASLAAARRFAEVTSTDFVPALLAQGRRRAETEGVDVLFQVADAEALQFADAAFDVALSTFGIMFTVDHARAASEIQRVVRPGGRIGMANWTPDSFIGQLLRTIAGHVPPPPGARSPLLWGTRGWLEEAFRAQAAEIAINTRAYVFRYRSPAHWLEIFRTWYGPMLKAFATLDGPGGAVLEGEIRELVARFNRASDGTMVVPSDYLEVVVSKA